MAKGIKTGGRQTGTPNRERKSLIEMISEKYPDYHPVMAMAEIANNKKADERLRFNANKEVAKYICPQLKSMELSSNNEGQWVTGFNYIIPQSELASKEKQQGFNFIVQVADEEMKKAIDEL